MPFYDGSGDELVGLVSTASGGCPKVALRNVNGTVQTVKAGAGVLYGIHVVNAQAAATFVQIFDAPAGSVTVGTTVPALEIEVGANSASYPAFPAVGVAFGSGICIAATTAEGGAVGSANGVMVYALYQ